MKIVYDYEIFYQQKYGGISRYFVQLTTSWEKRLHPLQTSSPKVVEQIPRHGVADLFFSSLLIEENNNSFLNKFALFGGYLSL